MLGEVTSAIGDAGGSVERDRHREGRRAASSCATSPSTPAARSTGTRSSAAVRDVEGVELLDVTDRTFNMHEGGKIEQRQQASAEEPRRPLDGLHAGRRAGLPGDPRGPRARVPLHDQAQLRRRRLRRLGRARPRRHRPARRDAGDGGQGDAAEGVRRRRRVPDLPRHERPGRDRRDREGDRARLRRHQPRGHLLAALLRDRGPPQGGARHPRLPRRPARHGRGRDGGALQRAEDHRQAPRGPARGDGRPRRSRDRGHAHAAPGRRARDHRLRHARRDLRRARRLGRDASAEALVCRAARTPSAARGGPGDVARRRGPVHRPLRARRDRGARAASA